MRLPFLRYLLVDCTGVLATDWFYSIGCLVSTLAVTNSASALVSFCLDYYTGEPIYHSLPRIWHCLLYTLCLLCAIAASIPPLVFGLMAIQGVQYEQHTVVTRLCGLAKFDNFYCHGSATRYLLLATLSSAFIILFNTLSVGALHLGVSSLFESHWIDHIASIDRFQRHYRCCGLNDYADWLKLAGRMPVSCNATTAAAGTANSGADDPMTQWQQKNRSSLEFRVYKNGCTSTLTSEQAVLCGVGNMLAFAGVLLLVAAWTRVERVAVITAQELKSKTFNQPRHVGDAENFLEKRQQQRLADRHPKYSTVTGSFSQQSETSSDYGRIKDNRLLLSEGFLHPDDSSERARRQGSSESDGNANNSALDPCGPWLSARVFNSIDREVALRRAWESVEQHGKTCCKDSASLLDEVAIGGDPPRQPLDASRLMVDGDAITSAVSGRRRHNRVVVRFVTQQRPALLTDLLSDWDLHGGRRLQQPFRTLASGCHPLVDCS